MLPGMKGCSTVAIDAQRIGQHAQHRAMRVGSVLRSAQGAWWSI